MIWYGLKYAWKSLRANKLCSAIGVIGLGLGLACTIVIVKYVHQEYTTDRFHENIDRLYYCVSRSSVVDQPEMSTIINWNKEITDYPEVERSTEVQFYPQSELTLEKQAFKANLMATDTSFAEIFTSRMISGDLRTLLSDPAAMIVTKRFAEKIMGLEKLLGKEVQFQGLSYKIGGIIEDFPENSSFSFDVIVSARQSFSVMGIDFILLKDKSSIQDVNRKLLKEEFRGIQKFEYAYEPFKELYFNPVVGRRTLHSDKAGDSRSLLILMLIGGVILAISIFNYVNIYQVALLKRNKELGVKRVFGIMNKNLFAGFWCENLLMVALATFAAGLLIVLASGFISSGIGVPVYLDGLFDGLLLGGILVVLPLVASLWPYFKYRRVRPALAIKKSSGRGSSGVRRGLLAVQYVMTTVMIIVSLYFMQQLDFMLNREIGLNHGNIAHVVFFTEKKIAIDWLDPEDVEAKREQRNLIREEHKRNVQYLENELANNPCIQSFCVGKSPLASYLLPWKLKGGNRDYQSYASLSVTPGFAGLYGLKIKEGRFFDPEKDKDREYKVVINEAARKCWNIGDIEDAWLANNVWGDEAKPWKVIGVVEDFHYEHLARGVQPLMMFYFDDNEDIPYQIGLTRGKEQEALDFLQGVYRKLNPEGEFSYSFFDDNIRAQYDKDRRVVRIFSVFTFLAVFISSMGLFGFAFFDARQRYKEIGIRRVNGATIGEVVLLLTRQFFILVCICFLVACPIAWVAIARYMEQFSEKAPLSVWLFLGAALLTGFIAFLTLFWQSYKASVENPVNSLKSE